MADTRKLSARPRQTSIRLGIEIDEQIATLRGILSEKDPLGRAVSAADVLRLAVRRLFVEETGEKKSSRKSHNRA